MRDQDMGTATRDRSRRGRGWRAGAAVAVGAGLVLQGGVGAYAADGDLPFAVVSEPSPACVEAADGYSRITLTFDNTASGVDAVFDVEFETIPDVGTNEGNGWDVAAGSTLAVPVDVGASTHRFVVTYFSRGADGTLTRGPQLADETRKVALCDPTAAYVTKVYSDLFNRAPDPTGLQNWTAALQRGVPYGEVANGITYSDEYRSRLIQASYQQYLGRAAEPAGLANWLAVMRSGKHIEQMQSGFISSPEFYARYGNTDRGWITGLYQTVLGRDPGTSEVDFWQGQIGAGANRSQVALGFLYSTEHLTTVVDGYYVDLLGRHIDPSGKATWVGQIQAGHRDEEIIASIVSSAEYRAKV